MGTSVVSRLERSNTFIATHCANCASDVRSRKRDFSSKAWQVLLFWNEVDKASIDKPICDPCYEELRDVLIDRSEEIETTVVAPPTKAAATAKRKRAS
jgi:hypothetical protein